VRSGVGGAAEGVAGERARCVAQVAVPIGSHLPSGAAVLEAAEKLLDGCPMSTGVRIYEEMPM